MHFPQITEDSILNKTLFNKIMDKKISKNFFNKSSDKVAKELLGKIIVRKVKGRALKARIVETEAYFNEKDPASWARFGKRKDNSVMWDKAGTILIKNVHKHFMLNFVTGRKGKPEAVLIRALEPLNFKERCNGPGLLTQALFVDKGFNGKSIFELRDFYINDSKQLNKSEIKSSFRIGVKKDLRRKLRFYIKNNKYISRK